MSSRKTGKISVANYQNPDFIKVTFRAVTWKYKLSVVPFFFTELTEKSQHAKL